MQVPVTLRRLVWVTLLIGTPLTLAGAMLSLAHPGGQVVSMVALLPATWLVARDVLSYEYLWLTLPVVQFAYYFCLVSAGFALRAAHRATSPKQK
jgi:hypothetical protein